MKLLTKIRLSKLGLCLMMVVVYSQLVVLLPNTFTNQQKIASDVLFILGAVLFVFTYRID